jgi:cytochrome c oxidase assembly protein Cox11
MKKLIQLKNFVMALRTVAIAISVLGLSYALVPLYQLYCQSVGAFGEAASLRTKGQSDCSNADFGDQLDRRQLTVYFHSGSNPA